MGICCSRQSSPRIQSHSVEFCLSLDMEKALPLPGKAKSSSAVGQISAEDINAVQLVQADERDRCQGEQVCESSQPACFDAIPEILIPKFAVIRQQLDDYCENPTATVFMQIYTCIYDLCNIREYKNAVCRAVYELFRCETQLCAHQLAAACQRLTDTPPASLQELSAEVLLEWRRLERRFHALQASFGYLDRYYVPRANLDTLSALRLSLLQAEGVEEHAQKMWRVLAASIRDGYTVVNFQRMQQLVDGWGALTHMAGMQEAAAATCASDVLKEHLAATFSEGRRPLGRPGRGGAAADRVLGMQRPLCKVIIDFLSEQDLFHTYSVQNMLKSV